MIARLLLGGILIAAGAGKLQNPGEFTRLVEGYGVFPHSLLHAAGISLPYAELLFGALIAAGFLPIPSVLAAALMSCAFITANIIDLLEGRPECRCFGSLITFKSSYSILIDVVMIFCSVLIWLGCKQKGVKKIGSLVKQANLGKKLAAALGLAVLLLFITAQQVVLEDNSGRVAAFSVPWAGSGSTAPTAAPLNKPAQLAQNKKAPGEEKAPGTLTKSPAAGSPAKEKTATGSISEAQPGAAGKTTGLSSVGVESKGEGNAINTEVESTDPAPDPQADFRSALSQGKPILVYFYLGTCGECNRQKPVIEAIQAAYGGKVSFVYVDGNNDRGMEDDFNVEIYPAIFLVERYRSTYSYTELKGFQTESMLAGKLENLLKKKAGENSGLSTG